MNTKTFIFSLFVILGLVACQNASQQSTVPTLVFAGANFETKNAVVFNESFAKKILTKDSIETVLRGEIESVCQMKGCWANLKSADGNSELFVQFKDYAFFVPKDIAGKTLTMKGKAYREMTSVEELRHYAEDEGKSKEEIEAITEPKEELKFLASGITWGE